MFVCASICMSVCLFVCVCVFLGYSCVYVFVCELACVHVTVCFIQTHSHTHMCMCEYVCTSEGHEYDMKRLRSFKSGVTRREAGGRPPPRRARHPTESADLPARSETPAAPRSGVSRNLYFSRFALDVSLPFGESNFPHFLSGAIRIGPISSRCRP